MPGRVPLRAAGLPLALYGCAEAKDFLGMGSYKQPLPGTRVSVLQLNQSLVADPSLADVKVLLPQPFANPDWPQAGGYPSHAMHHLALGNSLNAAWTVSVGTGDSSSHKLLSEPMVAEGRVFIMDARSRVSAFDAGSGSEVWRIDVAKDVDSDKLLGGGLAYDDGKIFVVAHPLPRSSRWMPAAARSCGTHALGADARLAGGERRPCLRRDHRQQPLCAGPAGWRQAVVA